MFQSLFSWNGRFHSKKMEGLAVRLKFQSLFSWNGRFHMVQWIVFSWQVLSFNPCFLGMGAFTDMVDHHWTNCIFVSILVFLEWALSLLHIIGKDSCCKLVSILVFLEWALSHIARYIWPMPSLRVSILVFLEWALSHDLFCHRRCFLSRVSILVFLEWALSLKLKRIPKN